MLERCDASWDGQTELRSGRSELLDSCVGVEPRRLSKVCCQQSFETQKTLTGLRGCFSEWSLKHAKNRFHLHLLCAGIL